LSKEKQRLEEAIDSMEKDRAQSHLELGQLRTDYQSAKKELAEKTTQLQEAHAKSVAVAEVASQQTNDQIGRLSTERDTAIKAWGRAEQRVTDLQTALRENELSVQRLGNDNERLARHLEELQAYRVQIEKSLQDTEQRLTSQLTDRVGETTGDDEVMVQAELENTKQLLSVVTREKQQILDWLEQSKQEHRNLLDSSAKREQEIKELASEREALQKMLENRTESSDHESRKLLKVREELRVIRQQRDELESTNDRLTAQLEATIESTAQLSTQSALAPPLETHFSSDSLEVVETDDDIELLDLRNQIRDRDIELNQSQRDIIKLQRKLQRIEETLSSSAAPTKTSRKNTKQKSPSRAKRKTASKTTKRTRKASPVKKAAKKTRRSAK